MIPIEIGQSFTVETTVDNTNTAATVGSGLLEVFATPMMIAQMELAASRCIAGNIEEGQASVGTKIDIAHNAATPVGMKVTATATVTAIDRRRVDFAVSAADEAGEIGAGIHTRFIVDTEKFMVKAAEKLIRK